MISAGCAGLAVAGLPDHWPHDVTQGVALDDGMKERRVEVDGIVVAAALLTDTEHAGPAEVTDDCPDLTIAEGQLVGEFLGGATLACGDAEQYGTVSRDVIPVVRSHIHHRSEKRPEARAHVGGETRKDPERAIADGYDGERRMDSWRRVRKPGLRLGHTTAPDTCGVPKSHPCWGSQAPANHPGDAGLRGGKIPSVPPAVNRAPLPHENEAIGASIRENFLPQRWPN